MPRDTCTIVRERRAAGWRGSKSSVEMNPRGFRVRAEGVAGEGYLHGGEGEEGHGVKGVEGGRQNDHRTSLSLSLFPSLSPSLFLSLSTTCTVVRERRAAGWRGSKLSVEMITARCAEYLVLYIGIRD